MTLLKFSFISTVRADIFIRFFGSFLIQNCGSLQFIFRPIFQISGQNEFELFQEYSAKWEVSNSPPRQSAGRRPNHKELRA